MADYTSDLITGGTPSADTVNSAGYEADKGCDNNTSTRWSSSNGIFPHWWKYDFGSGKTIAKLTLRVDNAGGAATIKDFTLQGSNNDSTWATVYTGQTTDDTSVQTFTFSNSTPYRYWMVYGTTQWAGAGNNVAAITEVEMMSELSSSGFFALL